MRPNSISMLIIQLFHLISNCNTVRCAHRCKGAFKADLYLQRQHTEDIFPLSSLNVVADLWPVCVFTLETLTMGLQTQNNRINKHRWWGCFLMSHHGLTFTSLEDYKKSRSCYFLYCFFYSAAFWRQIFHNWSSIKTRLACLNSGWIPISSVGHYHNHCPHSV